MFNPLRDGSAGDADARLRRLGHELREHGAAIAGGGYGIAAATAAFFVYAAVFGKAADAVLAIAVFALAVFVGRAGSQLRRLGETALSDDAPDARSADPVADFWFKVRAATVAAALWAWERGARLIHSAPSSEPARALDRARAIARRARDSQAGRAVQGHMRRAAQRRVAS